MNESRTEHILHSSKGPRDKNIPCIIRDGTTYEAHFGTGAPVRFEFQKYLQFSGSRIFLVREGRRGGEHDFKKLISYATFRPLGVAYIPVTYGEISRKLLLFVVEIDAVAILGRAWMRALGLEIVQTKEVRSLSVSSLANQVAEMFADIFTQKIEDSECCLSS